MGCDQSLSGLIKGHQGKDCGVPGEYAYAGGHFVSAPLASGTGEPMHSEIHSERATGLRQDYLNVWQMNRRIFLRNSNDEKASAFLPLLWIQLQPLLSKLNQDL